jgi:hypothetical protein
LLRQAAVDCPTLGVFGFEEVSAPESVRCLGTAKPCRRQEDRAFGPGHWLEREVRGCGQLGRQRTLTSTHEPDEQDASWRQDRGIVQTRRGNPGEQMENSSGFRAVQYLAIPAVALRLFIKWRKAAVRSVNPARTRVGESRSPSFFRPRVSGQHRPTDWA